MTHNEALIEVFGTSRPAESTIRRWRRSWRDNEQCCKIESFNETLKFIQEYDIDSLFYQIKSVDGIKHIVFFKNEDYVFFKIHNNI